MRSTLGVVAPQPGTTLTRVGCAVLVTAAVVVASWTASGTATSASHGISFVPRVGGPHATFVARFVAPFRISPSNEAYYALYVNGPCGRFSTSTYETTYLEPGDRATLVVGTVDLPRRTAWCPGRYVARITYERGRMRRTLFSGITFAVRSRDALRRFAARPDAVKLFPRVGGLRETFVLRFTAPYRSRGDSDYRFSGRGPHGCERVEAESASIAVFRHDRVVIELDNSSIESGRREWCAGSYVGHVDYVRHDDLTETERRRRVVSNIKFTVRG